MNPRRHARVSELFATARRLGADQLGAFLDRACAGDATLRAEVETLLAAEQRPAPLDAPVTGLRTMLEAVHTGATMPERIGRYRIRRQIGAGATGVVYEAEQDRPRRTVAVKVLRSQWSSAERVRRFEREAQILARLQHPGIARVYDAGIADTDRGPIPFLAMELVSGQPLTRFATEGRLGIRARLELFAHICDAVDCAHRNGVIHRDLKPANILVVAGEAPPRPVVLDFGVAHATDADITLLTVDTVAGQLVGTLPYMSPEQIEARPETLDLRSDVYALGVVLYELLSGCVPHDLRDLPLPEASRIIREEEPTRLGSRDTALRGEVETIVSKALAKDRERRYHSAAALAADVRRFLADQPILARPPSSLYQLRKFAQRNRGLVGGAATAAIALVAALVLTTLQAREARQAAAANEAILRELDLFLLVANTRPYRSAFFTQTFSPSASLREVMQQFADLVDQRRFDDPAVEAALRYRVGRGLFLAGDWLRGEHHLRAAHALFETQRGADDAKTLAALAHLGLCATWIARGDEGAALAARAEAGLRRVAESDDPEWFHAMTAVTIHQEDPQEEIRLARAMLSRLESADRAADFPRYEAQLLLGEGLCRAGRFAEGEAVLREVVAGCERTESTENRYFGLAVAMLVLGNAASAQGDPVLAEQRLRRAFDLFADNQGPDSDWLAWVQILLGKSLWELDRRAEAVALWVDSHAHLSARMGATSEQTLMALQWIAVAMPTAMPPAERTRWRGVVQRTAHLAAAEVERADYSFLRTLHLLARNLTQSGEHALAASLARTAVDNEKAAGGPPSARTLRTLDTLAVAEHRRGNHAAALALFEEIEDLQRQDPLLDPSEHAEILLRQGELLLAEEQPARALDALQRAVDDLPAAPTGAGRGRAMRAVIDACEALGRTGDADRWRARLAGLSQQ